MAELLETIKILFEESFPWLAPFIAPVILFFRWHEKKKKRSNERRIESKVDYLIEMGGGKWSADTSKACAHSSQTIKGYSRLWLTKLSFARFAARNTRLNMRRINMNSSSINWATLVPCLLGAVKLILQPMGINIPDQNLNEIANGIAALATVIGIVYSHRKGATTNANSQHITGDGPAV